ncbi:MAG: hypothetical protein WCA81_12040 [Rhizomicrobium sp.]
MRDLDKALADILEIRSQIAAGTAFRGYGPAAISITGLLGFVTALTQSIWLSDPNATPVLFIAEWIATAIVAGIVIRIEMQGRSRRLHSGLADAMIHQAIEQFRPAIAASLFMPLLFLRFAPQSVWMLPGLWQLFVSLGIFASVRTLPRSMTLAGGWYFLTGFLSLVLASQSHALSPWLMGLPFLGGQLLMASILYFSTGDADGED